MKYFVFGLMVFVTLFSCSEKKEKKTPVDRNAPLGKYLYVDKADIIHSKNDCKAVFKKNNAQSVDVVPVRYVWVSSGGLQNICSKCVSNLQINQLDSITNSIAYRDRRWLYEKLKDDYDDCDDWRQVNYYLDDKDNRKALYNEIKDKYGLGSFDEFDERIMDYFDKKTTKIKIDY